MSGNRRALTALWTIALFFAIIAVAGFVALDFMIDERLPAPSPGSVLTQGAALLDVVLAKQLGDWLLPVILVAAGLILLILRATRATGFPLLYVGLVHLLSYGAAQLLAPAFGRVPPAAAVTGGDLWFEAGNAFPSAHTGFYAGLFLPLVLLFPRLSPLWIAPPLLVAVADVAEQDHYLSDVSASVALAAALAAGLSFIAEKGRS